MFFILLGLFTIIPIVEITLLIKVGGNIGVMNTLLLVFLTGFYGALLAKGQGMEVLNKINAAGAEGRMPAAELIDGLMILIGGVTLLTPGFFTDFIGLSLLFPMSRSWIKIRLTKFIEKKISRGEWNVKVYRG